jgi:hypothetical protein
LFGLDENADFSIAGAGNSRRLQGEYVEFLKRHNIEYRLEYLFEDEHDGQLLPPLCGSRVASNSFCGLTPAAMRFRRFAVGGVSPCFRVVRAVLCPCRNGSH